MLGWSVGFAILAVFATAVAYWGLAAGPAIGAAALVFVLSFRLKPDQGRPDVRIDFVRVG